MSLVVEMLLPSDCLNINEFRAIHMNTHSDAYEYSLEQELLPIFQRGISICYDQVCLFSIPLSA